MKFNYPAVPLDTSVDVDMLVSDYNGATLVIDFYFLQQTIATIEVSVLGC